MGRFGQMIGKLKFNIEGEVIEVKPKLGDNDKLMSIQNSDKLNENEKLIQIKEFIVELLTREYPNEKEDIALHIEINFREYLRELLVAFKWTTREKFESSINEVEQKEKN